VADIVILASGNGSNFEVLTMACRAAGHDTALLICDKPHAPVLERARRLGVPAMLVWYPMRGSSVPTDTGRSGSRPDSQSGDRLDHSLDKRLDKRLEPRAEYHAGRAAVEAAMIAAIDASAASLVVLAGFMRLLGSAFVAHYAGRLVNIHPSLLPAYPGKDAIRRAWAAGEAELGVTVHQVDAGMDSGSIIAQVRCPRVADLAMMEAGIHELEHSLYPEVVLDMLGTRCCWHAGPLTQQ
jgi:phosphoribosylglycinamide formyltransferase-1